MNEILDIFKDLYDFIFWDVIFLLISIAGGLGASYLFDKIYESFDDNKQDGLWAFLYGLSGIGTFLLIGYLIDFPQFDTLITLAGILVLLSLLIVTAEFFRIFVYGILFIQDNKFPVLSFTLRAIGVLGIIWFVVESPYFVEAVETWYFYNIERRSGIEILGILLFGILGGYLLAGLFLRIQEFFIESKDEESLPNSKEAFVTRLCFCTLGIIFAFFVSS